MIPRKNGKKLNSCYVNRKLPRLVRGFFLMPLRGIVEEIEFILRTIEGEKLFWHVNLEEKKAQKMEFYVPKAVWVWFGL